MADGLQRFAGRYHRRPAMVLASGGLSKTEAPITPATTPAFRAIPSLTVRICQN